jgi:hypothetical protein
VTLRELQSQLGVHTGDVRGLDGRVANDVWTAGKDVVVRVVSVWFAIWCLLLNKPFVGVLLVRRRPYRRPLFAPHGGGRVGFAEPDEGTPDVVLDYETYARLLVGLSLRRLEDLEIEAEDD